MLNLLLFSIEAERSFSAVGFFVTKLQTMLNDYTINKLCLRSSDEKSKKNKVYRSKNLIFVNCKNSF